MQNTPVMKAALAGGLLLCLTAGPAGQNPAAAITIRLGTTTSDGDVHIESLPLEDYVARVVAGEGQPRAAAGAQEALAIAIRTFALANRNRHRREGYDLCDTTHCQIPRAATATSRQAAAATAGRVLVHQGQPATVFYSAWCGGRSERASEVWPGAPDYPFEPSQRDEACEDEPEWSSEVSDSQIETALRVAGLRGERLRELRILDRNRSGRVTRLRASGFTPSDVSGHDFRTAFGRTAGWQVIKSTAFELRRTSSGYRVTGRGAGHGVGLCVIGAGHRAARGADVEEILHFYYPGLRIERYTTEMTNVAPAAPARPAISPRAADVLLALPGSQESERVVLSGLVRSARDEIAARSGMTGASPIRITVHATSESFGRSTGQPWWVSGVTDGSHIELVPVSILRQRGQLERTIRREVAHVLLDTILAQRPLWVREGAASYFADPSAAADSSLRRPCPADAELLQPLSAGAQRDAIARAEACFRRAIAEGKRWDQIR